MLRLYAKCCLHVILYYMQRVHAIIDEFPPNHRSAACIPVLDLAQRQNNGLSQLTFHWVCEAVGMGVNYDYYYYHYYCLLKFLYYLPVGHLKLFTMCNAIYTGCKCSVGGGWLVGWLCARSGAAATICNFIHLSVSM